MDARHRDGDDKAFLHDYRCCAFPEEKEYLIGWSSWMVTAITEETLEYEGKSFDAVIINLF